jgi:hypothetical protein
MAACTFRPKIRTAPKLTAAPKPFSDVQGAKSNGQVKGTKKPQGSNHPSVAVPAPVSASGATTHGPTGQAFKFNGVSYSEMPLGDANTFALVAEGPSSAMPFVLSGTGPAPPDTKKSSPPIVVTSLAPALGSSSQGMQRHWRHASHGLFCCCCCFPSSPLSPFQMSLFFFFFFFILFVFFFLICLADG